MKKVSEQLKESNMTGHRNPPPPKDHGGNKQKWVSFVLTHQTSYLKTGWSYLTQKEDDGWYWFDFDGKTVKYPKFYFVDGYELN